MNRRSVLRGLLTTGTLCALHGMGAAALRAAATQGIPMTTHYSLQHPVTQQVFIPWANNLRTLSQGALDVRIMAPDVLCPDENVYNSILMNTVTLGGFAPNIMISPLPVARLMEYALLYPDARRGSQIVWDAFCNSPALQGDLGLMHILWTWISPAMYLHTTGKPIRSLDDIRNMRIVVWDTTASTLVTALGALPVFSPAHFSVHMLRMHMADAVIAPFAPLAAFELLPLLKCTLDLPLTNACFFAGFNREVWSALPKKDQDLLESTTGSQMAAACGESLDANSVQIRAHMVQQGHTFMMLSPTDREELYRPLLALRDESEREMVIKGILPEEGLMPLLRRARERILYNALPESAFSPKSKQQSQP